MSKQRYKIAAVVDIGSSVVRMIISQWDGKEITILDHLEKPTQLGKEVFSTGYISFDTLRSLSGILQGFCEKAREYGITSVHAIAATALREATNQAFVLDHISTRNKINVKVQEETELGSLLLNAAKNSGYPKMDLQEGKVLLVHGGTGTTDFELLNDGKISIASGMKTGILKIAEMLREAAEFSGHVEDMAEQYLNTFLTRENRIKDLWKADVIVFNSDNLSLLYRLCSAENDIGDEKGAVVIPVDYLTEIYKKYRVLPMEQICQKQNIDIENARLLYAVITMLYALLKLTKAKKLFCVQISSAEAMTGLILKPEMRKSHGESICAGAIASATDLAERYRCDLHHASYVSGLSLTLFEKLRKLMGFPKKQNLFLYVACLLHGAGHYTNSDNSEEATFNLIKRAHIYGLCAKETLLVANIIAPQNLPGISRNFNRERRSTLSNEDSLFAAKMHALMRLADSLDYSHRQKAKLLDVSLDGDDITICLQIKEDYTLEQWVFKERAKLFEAIFGITPKIKTNNIYYAGGK